MKINLPRLADLIFISEQVEASHLSARAAVLVEIAPAMLVLPIAGGGQDGDEISARQLSEKYLI